MPVKSKHYYYDPQTGGELVEPGDDLTPDVVEALGKVGAIRVKPDQEDGSSCNPNRPDEAAEVLEWQRSLDPEWMDEEGPSRSSRASRDERSSYGPDAEDELLGPDEYVGDCPIDYP